jgi:hypothetical protein
VRVLLGMDQVVNIQKNRKNIKRPSSWLSYRS